jgi:hypothetical protein
MRPTAQLLIAAHQVENARLTSLRTRRRARQAARRARPQQLYRGIAALEHDGAPLIVSVGYEDTELVIGLQCAEGVDVGAAQQNLEVQVRPARSAGRADGSKTLTDSDKLPGNHVD